MRPVSQSHWRYREVTRHEVDEIRRMNAEGAGLVEIARTLRLSTPKLNAAMRDHGIIPSRPNATLARPQRDNARAAIAERIKPLADAGRYQCEIAQALGISRAMVRNVADLFDINVGRARRRQIGECA